MHVKQSEVKLFASASHSYSSEAAPFNQDKTAVVLDISQRWFYMADLAFPFKGKFLSESMLHGLISPICDVWCLGGTILVSVLILFSLLFLCIQLESFLLQLTFASLDDFVLREDVLHPASG